MCKGFLKRSHYVDKDLIEHSSKNRLCIKLGIKITFMVIFTILDDILQIQCMAVVFNHASVFSLLVVTGLEYAIMLLVIEVCTICALLSI